eukprot:2233291-Rhodomonas_salina.1
MHIRKGDRRRRRAHLDLLDLRAHLVDALLELAAHLLHVLAHVLLLLLELLPGPDTRREERRGEETRGDAMTGQDRTGQDTRTLSESASTHRLAATRAHARAVLPNSFQHSYTPHPHPHPRPRPDPDPDPDPAARVLGGCEGVRLLSRGGWGSWGMGPGGVARTWRRRSGAAPPTACAPAPPAATQSARRAPTRRAAPHALAACARRLSAASDRLHADAVSRRAAAAVVG